MSSAGIKTRTARAGCSPFNESEREWPGEGEEGEEIIREMEELVRLLHRRGVEGQVIAPAAPPVPPLRPLLHPSACASLSRPIDNL